MLPTFNHTAEHDRARFLALVAGRLGTLPSPFPDLALFCVVLSGFSAFRQTFGEAAADQVLQGSCAALRHFAPDATIGQLLDGFMFSYELDAAWTSLADVASDLRAVIDGPSDRNRLALAAPSSIGVALYAGGPRKGTSLDAAAELFRQATLAAQLASSRGHTGFLVYSREEEETLRNATILDQSIRMGIARDEFQLYYQPLVDLRTRAMVGLEGLLRWATQAGAVRGPDEFIPAAEASGLIVPIGRGALEAAMRQVAEWRSAGWTAPRVGVNVSASQLLDPEFYNIVVGALAIGQVTPDCLEIEMTERTLITGSNTTRRLLDSLRDFGVKIALDDFGTGFSSLQYLRDLPISKIKIDKAFIRHIAVDKRDAALVRAMTGIAEALELEIVAEGVEHDDQAAKLLECGCLVGQGYLFSRAQPASLVPALEAKLRPTTEHLKSGALNKS